MHPPIQKITTSLPKINAASYFEHYGADYKDVIKLSPEVIQPVKIRYLQSRGKIHFSKRQGPSDVDKQIFT